MFSDLRFALRALLRAPGFTGSAVLALALGIGANTAVFSVVYAVLLQPPPYPEPERLVRLYESNPAEGIERAEVSVGTFADWRARSHTIESLAMYSVPLNGETLWTIGDQVQVVRTSAVSPALFAVLRVQPVLGRPLAPESAAPAPGAMGQFVIGYAFWQRAFGGAADVIGRRVMIEGRLPREIIGVMPPGFAFPEGTEAWTAAPVSFVPPPQRRQRSGQVIARLAAGTTLDDALRDLRGISQQLGNEHPASNAGWTADIEPLRGSDARQARLALLTLMGAVAGVLLIGCVNLANLLLARAVRRRREFAIRLALGSGAARVVRLALAEAALLAGGGIAAGLVLGEWIARALVRLAPPDIPRLGDVRSSAAVFAFAILAGLLAAVITSVAPVLQMLRAQLHAGIRPDVRAATDRGARLHRWLIASEAAVVVLLLSGAMLLVRTFVKLRAVDLGFDTQHVVEVETRWPIGTLFGNARGQQWSRVQRAVDGLMNAVTTLPGVEAAGLVSDVPLTGAAGEGAVWRADAPGAAGLNPPADPRSRWKTDVSVVTPGYFAALRIPLLRGRNFTSADRLSDEQLASPVVPRSGVVIVNSEFASKYFPNEDPVGRTLVAPDLATFGAVRTIIGVVGDVRGRTVAEAPRPMAFIPHAENPDVFRPSLLIRSSLPYSAISEVVRRRISEYDSHLLVLRIRPMDDVVSGALARPRFNLLLLSSFAIVALALSAIGIYGVLAYLVTQRTREIGIRVALGARPGDVLRLIVREGMMPVIAGASIGVAVSVAAGRVIRSLLFGVTPADFVSLTGAPVLLAGVALLACYLPARRALHVDPMTALRAE